jgi:hypothetical protein
MASFLDLRPYGPGNRPAENDPKILNVTFESPKLVVMGL